MFLNIYGQPTRALKNIGKLEKYKNGYRVGI